MATDEGPTDVVAAFERAADRGLRRKPLLVAGHRSLSYGSLLERTSRTTRWLRDRGAKPGERMVIASRDPVATVALHLALLRNGITSVPVDPGSSPREARAILESAAPSALFLDADLRETWSTDSALPQLTIARPASRSGELLRRLLPERREPAAEHDTYPALLENLEPAEPPALVDPQSDAYVLFTSGTTSGPKGVRISHRALFDHLATLRRQFGYGRSTRILNVLPLHHTDGLNHGPVVAFSAGGAVFRPAPFTLQGLPDLLDSVYAERLTHLVTVPSMLAMIERLGGFEDAFAPEDFRFVVSSAAPLPAALWKRFEERFATRVANVYGLTETVVGGLFCGPEGNGSRFGSVGRPVDCEARILGSEGGPVQQGAEGELELRGTNLLSGYLGDPAATDAALHGGWFRTGDLAVRDADGRYRIVGRRKSLIIRSGINVQPEEVDEVLLAAPGVAEAVTFGVEDPLAGQRIVACVTLRDDAEIDAAGLVAHCRRQLAPAKVPDRVHVLPSLPKGASGKIRVEAVRALLDRTSRREGARGSGAPEARVLAIAADIFQIDPGELDLRAAAGRTPGWDSLGHLDLVVALEEEFGIRLQTREILRIGTLHDVAEIVASRLS